MLTSYIENCIGEAHAKICGTPESKEPVPQQLTNIEKIVGNQGDASSFHISETKSFFAERNKVIHGQIYGRRSYGEIVLCHKRTATHNQVITLGQINRLIDTAQMLLARWQAIRLSRLR